MGNTRDIYGLFVQILSFVMIFVYAGMGIIFLAIPEFYPVLKGTTRYILGILLVVYAIYRIFRLVKQYYFKNAR